MPEAIGHHPHTGKRVAPHNLVITAMTLRTILTGFGAR
jgi:hypothetical protein